MRHITHNLEKFHTVVNVLFSKCYHQNAIFCTSRNISYTTSLLMCIYTIKTTNTQQLRCHGDISHISADTFIPSYKKYSNLRLAKLYLEEVLGTLKWFRKFQAFEVVNLNSQSNIPLRQRGWNPSLPSHLFWLQLSEQDSYTLVNMLITSVSVPKGFS